MNKESFNLAIQILRQAKTFLIATHENPDGDGVGTSLALGLALEQLNKKVDYYSSNVLPQNLTFLSNSSQFSTKIPRQEFDVLVSVDASEMKRLNLPRGVKYKICLNIDHHPQKKPFGKVNLVAPSAAATAEIAFLIIQELGIKDANIATNLLCGLFTDTGSFQHANTTARTMEIAASLMKDGANLNKIAQETLQSKSLSALKVRGLALARIKHDYKNGVTLSAITQKDLKTIGAKPEDLEGVVNILNTAEGTKYAILFLEQKGNKVKASLRSEKGRGIDVAKIAARYGGGGHPLASGFTIKGKLARKSGKWIIKK